MTTSRVLFVAKTDNRKVGPMPVTYTDATTCPDACPLKNDGCYASAGFPTRKAWRRAGTVGLAWDAFVEKIKALPIGTVWRHNVAGDLPGENEAIDVQALASLVDANRGKHGFTYTHKPMVGRNIEAVAAANKNGFTVNLSADNMLEADELAALGIAPVVMVLPSDAPEKLTTPGGRTVVVCPEQTGKMASCLECKACSRADRKPIIGFRAHGLKAKSANRVALNLLAA